MSVNPLSGVWRTEQELRGAGSHHVRTEDSGQEESREKSTNASSLVTRPACCGGKQEKPRTNKQTNKTETCLGIFFIFF